MVPQGPHDQEAVHAQAPEANGPDILIRLWRVPEANGPDARAMQCAKPATLLNERPWWLEMSAGRPINAVV